jgi:hypothetical protein
VIAWIFDITNRDSIVRRLKDETIQRGKSELIIEERFSYVSAAAWKLVS